jgi:hypothetical protein
MTKDIYLDPLSLELDPKNYRIPEEYRKSQSQLIKWMIEKEEVIQLAKGIVQDDPPLFNERVVATKEHGKYVVLEGNRRVCATKLLLDPDLAGAFKNKIPVLNKKTKDQLKKIEVLLILDRDSAETYISRRHTTQGVKSWNTAAKQRWVSDLYNKYGSIAEVSKKSKMTKTAVGEYLKDYSLLTYSRELKGWTKEEKAQLNDIKLKTTPFTRFFRQEGVQDVLKMEINDDFGFTLGMQKNDFDKSIEFLTRKFLLKQTTEPKKYNTRAIPKEVFKDLLIENPNLKKSINSSKFSQLTTIESVVHQPRKIEAPFFRDLVYHKNDRVIKRLVYEISTIRYGLFRTSATFLFRALMERISIFLIDRYDLRGKLYEGHPNDWTPGLSDYLAFCMKEHDQIFIGNHRGGLNRMVITKKYCDEVIHGKREPDTDTLLGHTRSLKIFIDEIINEKILKVPS